MAEQGRGRRPAMRFAGGFLVGFVVVPLVGVTAMVALMGAGALRLPGPAHAVFVLSGADVTRAGGVTIIVRRTGETTALSCRGTCDDLHLDRNVAYGLQSVKVGNAKDACVLCRSVAPAETKIQPEQWRVAGQPLEVKHD